MYSNIRTEMEQDRFNKKMNLFALVVLGIATISIFSGLVGNLTWLS